MSDESKKHDRETKAGLRRLMKEITSTPKKDPKGKAKKPPKPDKK